MVSILDGKEIRAGLINVLISRRLNKKVGILGIHIEVLITNDNI